MRKLVCACAVMVAGCSSDPATEPPVQLRPGSYEVVVGGGTMVELKSGERRGLVCLDPSSASMFTSNPLAQLTSDWDGCSDEYAEPKGNALSGKRTCERKRPVLVTYTGRHTADSFELEGTVSQGNDEGGGVMRLGSGDFSITGKRLGDC